MKNQNRVTDRLRTGSIVPAGSRFSAAGRDPSYRGGGGGSFSFEVPDRFSIDFSALANGGLPGAFYAPTWSIYNGKAINAPTLGSELLTNGNMETGNPPTGWAAGGTSTLSGAADERTGGSGVQSLNVVRGSHVSESVASKTTSGGQVGWHRGESWVKNISADLVYMINPAFSVSTNSTEWTKLVSTRLISPAAAITATMRINGGSTEEARFDDVSIKKIGAQSLFATIDQGRSCFDLILPSMPDLLQGTQAGAVVCLDSVTSPAGYVVVFYYHNQAAPSTTIEVVALSGGVYTTLSSTSVSYSPGKFISLKKTGDQMSVFYGTAEFVTRVGSDVTIPAALSGNTKHGLFSTTEFNSFYGVFKIGKYTP